MRTSNNQDNERLDNILWAKKKSKSNKPEMGWYKLRRIKPIQVGVLNGVNVLRLNIIKPNRRIDQVPQTRGLCDRRL